MITLRLRPKACNREQDKFMATRTAPNPDVATPNKVISTLHLIDASGDLYTDSLTTLGTVATSDLELWADAYQVASQASIYKISQENEWSGVADADNADVFQRNSGTQGINLLFKNPAVVDGITPRVVAPAPATMQGNQDIPIVTDPSLANLIVVYLAILTGYDLDSAQYTTHRTRQNNPKIKV